MACLPWPLNPRCLPDGWDPANLTEEQQAAVDAARQLLSSWAGGWYGQCEVTIRPCGTVDAPCTGPCRCEPVCRVYLPFPATGIVTIHDGDTTIPVTDVRIDDYMWLVREDGGCWRGCQLLNRPLGEPGTWGVTYLQGWPPPMAASTALTRLAVDIYGQCEDGRCLPPANASRINRQGVTIELDPDKYRLRVREVGVWLDIANPDGRRGPLRAWSPDLPDPTVTTWTGGAP